MTNKLAVAMGVASIALAAAAFYFYRDADAQHGLLDEEAAARHQSDARFKELQARYDGLQASYAALVLEHRDTGGAGATVPHPPSQSLGPRTNYSSAIRSEQPVNVPSDRERQRPFGPRQVALRSAVDSLKLSPADAEKALEILTADQDKLRQAFASNQGKPMDENVIEAIEKNTEQQLRELLGDQKYQEYQDYQRFQMEHEQVNRLNTRLANTNQGALSQDQQTQLFNIMKDERNRIPQPTPAQYATRPDFYTAAEQWRASYVERTQSRAATVLTPEQLTAYKNMRGPMNGPMNGPPLRRNP